MRNQKYLLIPVPKNWGFSKRSNRTIRETIELNDQFTWFYSFLIHLSVANYFYNVFDALQSNFDEFGYFESILKYSVKRKRKHAKVIEIGLNRKTHNMLLHLGLVDQNKPMAAKGCNAVACEICGDMQRSSHPGFIAFRGSPKHGKGQRKSTL